MRMRAVFITPPHSRAANFGKTFTSNHGPVAAVEYRYRTRLYAQVPAAGSPPALNGAVNG